MKMTIILAVLILTDLSPPKREEPEDEPVFFRPKKDKEDNDPPLEINSYKNKEPSCPPDRNILDPKWKDC